MVGIRSVFARSADAASVSRASAKPGTTVASSSPRSRSPQPLERQRTPAPYERTDPCPLLHDEAPAREPSGIRHAAPEPSIDAAQVPVPDPGARDGVHAADPSGVRIRVTVLEGFPVDLGQSGTDVKARCNRVHDAGGGARRPPRARMLSDSPSRPQKAVENTRMPALRSLFCYLVYSVWQKTPDFQSVAGIARAFARFRMLDFG